MSDKSLRVLVSGKVQGVWYRQSTLNHAERLGLTGWVRNLPDGRVEALLQGDGSSLDSMLAWMQIGPEHARVTQLETEPVTVTEQFRCFTIEPA